MKRLAAQPADLRRQFFRQFVDLGLEGHAIVLIADQRMADVGHVDADLVGPAGFQTALDQ